MGVGGGCQQQTWTGLNIMAGGGGQEGDSRRGQRGDANSVIGCVDSTNRFDFIVEGEVCILIREADSL